MPELPSDWREQVTAMVRSEAPADGSMFDGGPVLSPLDQIGVYRRQYHLRMTDVIAQDLVGLEAFVDAKRLHGWIERYLDAHPPDTWTLNRASWTFADWLATQDVSRGHIELAELDRAVQQGFEAAEGEPLTAADLQSMPRVRLAPCVSLLRHQTNAHAVRSALLTDRPPPRLREDPSLVVLYRAERRMRHWIFEPAPFALLEHIEGGMGIMEALGQIASEGHIDAAELGQHVGPWFRDFVRDGLLCPVPSDEDSP